MTPSDEEIGASVGFTAEECRLILEELQGMRAELRAGRREMAARPTPRPRRDEFDSIEAVCTAWTPAEILADHERRIQALEQKAS